MAKMTDVGQELFYHLMTRDALEVHKHVRKKESNI